MRSLWPLASGRSRFAALGWRSFALASDVGPAVCASLGIRLAVPCIPRHSIGRGCFSIPAVLASELPTRAVGPPNTHMCPPQHSTWVSARMGFVPIPLFCLVVRVVGHDVWPLLNGRHPSGVLLCTLVWLVACALKLLTTITLLGF
eukprot:4748095-Prymnesium_polylepis.1